MMDDGRPDPILGLLARLNAIGAELRIDGDSLRVRAPRGSMTDELAEAIKTHKAGLLDALRARASAAEAAPSWKPLSAAQERFWAHEALEEKPGLYNLPSAWRLTGPLDVDIFAAAFADIVNRHDVMRVIVRLEDGAPLQKVQERRDDWLAVEDLSEEAASEEALADRLEALSRSAIDLESGPAFHARLLRLSPEDHVLFLMPHHVIWDGFSFDLFLIDLAAFYEARKTGAESERPAVTQYPDYAVAMGDAIADGALDGAVDYWAQRLTPTPKPVDLPTDQKRPKIYDFSGDWTTFHLGAEPMGRLRAIAGERRATPFMAMFALWRAFVSRLTDNDDIVIAAPVLMRDHASLDNAIGCFANAIYLRAPLSFDASLADLVENARTEIAAGLPYAEAPVERLFERLDVDRDPSRPPLAQVMFSYQDTDDRPQGVGQARLEQIHLNARVALAELMLSVTEEGDSARCDIVYADGLFSAEQVASIARAFQTFVDAALADPATAVQSLPMAGAADVRRQKERDRAADEAFDAPQRLDQWIAQAAAARPDAPAVIAGGAEVSYSALLTRANVIAGALAAAGVGAGDIVGVMTERNADMVAATLAAWRIGAAYLPLDPAYPQDRLRYMAEDSGARAIITDRDTSEHVALDACKELYLEDMSEANAAAPSTDEHFTRAFDPSERAYVIYTSGSTGRPKGVENSHGPLFNFISSMAKAPGITADDRLLAVTTLAFDISILELFLPLTAGGVVILAGEEDVSDPFALTDLMAATTPSAMQATPSTWRLLLDGGWEGASRLKALCGGEPLPGALAVDLTPKVASLWNMYGPTETTVWSACRQITGAGDITVGKPIANTTLYIADRFGALAPDGVPGELLIGGAGVALGYLGREDLTAERFIPDPFSATGGRLYRTGDLARRRHDGDYEILGRLDDQVKVRGHRIELGEIEKSLDQLPEIAKAVAAVRRDAAGEPALVAFIKCADGEQAVSSAMRRALRKTLPAYMLPQMFIEIDDIPLTNNGKIDRKALPEIVADAGAPREQVSPRNEIEQAIAEIWREMLPVETISVTDNFFDLGGQSLQAARMAAIVKDRLGRRISPRSVIFETLEQLANASEAV